MLSAGPAATRGCSAPACGSVPAMTWSSTRTRDCYRHPRTERVGAGMGPARQRRPAAVPARAPGRPALRHPGLPPRGYSHRRGHHLRRRPGDRNLQPVRRRPSGRAVVAQRPAGGCRTPAGPAHRRLRARHRPGTGPASRMPGPRPAPRLGARSCTMTAPRTSRRAGHRGPARPRAGSPKRSPGQPQSHGAAGAPDPAIARLGAVRCSGMRERRGMPIDLSCTLQLMDAVRSAAAPADLAR